METNQVAKAHFLKPSQLLSRQLRTELPQLPSDAESKTTAATDLRDRLGLGRLAGYEQ